MRLHSENPLSGIKNFWDYDEDTDEHVFTTHIDQKLSNAVVERNKTLEGQGMGKDLRLAASIPPEVQFEWLDKFGVKFWDPEHKPAVRKLLNSNEYRYLRINHFML